MKKKSIKNNTIIQPKPVASKPRNISEPRSGKYNSLKKDYARLQMELEILKKAAKYCCKINETK